MRIAFNAVVWGLPGCLPVPVDLSPRLRRAVEAAREERPRALDCASGGVTGRSGLERGSRPDVAEPDPPRPRGSRREVLFPLGVPGGAAAVRGQVEEGRGRRRETLRPARVGQSEGKKRGTHPWGWSPRGLNKILPGGATGPIGHGPGGEVPAHPEKLPDRRLQFGAPEPDSHHCSR
ncbi:hypothetical protein NDU88_007368 [Pleurodeles waltl]|uniref:Uncharacterized protein n=1 Tax=Pleurodeles waltl TaxID=8319 RepID=A0AAV7NVS3_PLEWA|nr:hypothetical protein NDU88_007368 [Pleurodeles waltl]